MERLTISFHFAIDFILIDCLISSVRCESAAAGLAGPELKKASCFVLPPVSRSVVRVDSVKVNHFISFMIDLILTAVCSTSSARWSSLFVTCTVCPGALSRPAKIHKDMCDDILRVRK